MSSYSPDTDKDTKSIYKMTNTELRSCVQAILEANIERAETDRSNVSQLMDLMEINDARFEDTLEEDEEAELITKGQMEIILAHLVENLKPSNS